MARLNTMAAQLTQSALIYGPPKVGKTQLAGELAMHPEIERIIWVDLENGVSTLMKLPTEIQAKIEVIQLPDTRSNPVGIETCLKLVRGTPVTICDEHGVVGCMTCRKANAAVVNLELNTLPANWVVVFDSLTQLTDSAISFITKGKPDDYKLQFDDWGDLGKLMSVFLSHVQQAKYNVICISHEVEAEREDGTVRVVPVAGTRNFSRNTAKYFGHCIYAEVKAKKHVFTSSTTGTSNVVAGSRTDVRLEDIKDGKGSLFPIFAAAARSVTGTKSEPVVEDAKVKSEASIPAKEEVTQVKEEPAVVTEIKEEPTPSPAVDMSVEVKPEVKADSSDAPVDHAAILGTLTLMERIKYKKAHGIK